MSFRKTSLQEFQHQFKDIRSQLYDQSKCLEQRTADQTAIFQEINEFVKKRAELDLQYSKELDKLVKSVMLKHKNEKQRRTNWSLYSICNLWQQIVDDAKEEAKQRSIVAEIYANNVVPTINNKCATMQKISKKCREIGLLANGEIVRVINELSLAMKTYQHCYAQVSVLGTKLQQADEQKKKTMDAGSNSSTRKQRSVQKIFDKKSEKFEVARQKCTRARNEYLLCIEAANAALFKYFSDDVSDVVDCSDLGLDCWLDLVLQNIIAARKSACQTEMNALANLGSFKAGFQSQADKQRFFENHHQTFMLPKRFHFKCEPSENISKILTENLADEFKQRHHQIRKRLNTLRAESESSLKNMEAMERQMRDLLTASTLVEINEFGIVAESNRPGLEEMEAELMKLYEQYSQTFSFFLLNANLISRLEARADGIGNGLKELDEEMLLMTPKSRHLELEGIPKNDHQSMSPEEMAEYDQNSLMQRRKRRIGSQASTELAPSPWSRPRLFGGSLQEYTEATEEPIPLIVVSCIRALSQFALQHQGIFRIAGSRIEISRMREAFECGDDPLKEVKDATDANSIASLLKLYLRELREPLFPFYLFDLLTDCAKCSSIADFVSKIGPLLNKLPQPSYLLLRYLFSFLNHLSEFSDENMMDPYNLAICLGPTLLPIPEGKDQVFFQNSVNEVVKNLIVHCHSVFSQRIPGPRYEKYNFSSLGTPIEPEMELFMDDEVSQEIGISTNSVMPSSNFGPANEMDDEPGGSHHPIGGGHHHNPTYNRLPFLANYPSPKSTDHNAPPPLISQSLMEFSTSSRNSGQFSTSPATMAVHGGTRPNLIAQSHQNANYSSINNYSSTESGISAPLEKMGNLRLMSPPQIQSAESNEGMHQFMDKNKDGGGGMRENEPTAHKDLYASIKRNERIRNPVAPLTQPQAIINKSDGDGTREMLALQQQQQILSTSNKMRPPSYHSIFERNTDLGQKGGGGGVTDDKNTATFQGLTRTKVSPLPSTTVESEGRKNEKGENVKGKNEGVDDANKIAGPLKSIDDLLEKLTNSTANNDNDDGDGDVPSNK